MAEPRQGWADEFWAELAKLFPGRPASLTAVAFGGPYVLEVGGYTIKAKHQHDLLGHLQTAMAAAGRCTCNGEFWPDGSRVVTVGCRVHHLMADGEPAADHEILCMCGNFADDRECAVFVNEEEEGDEPLYVCGECRDHIEKQPHMKLDRGSAAGQEDSR